MCRYWSKICEVLNKYQNGTVVKLSDKDNFRISKYTHLGEDLSKPIKVEIHGFK
jgi:hypothetical protein